MTASLHVSDPGMRWTVPDARELALRAARAVQVEERPAVDVALMGALPDMTVIDAPMRSRCVRWSRRSSTCPDPSMCGSSA
jgi:hypothetical protein